MLSLVLIGLLISACNMCEKQKKKEDLLNAMSTWDKWDYEKHEEELKKFGIEQVA